jgi:hypothetical protein
MLSRQAIERPASQETTMRHALVTVGLIHEARTLADAPDRRPTDAPPDPPATTDPRPRRLATLARRARALVARRS